MSQKTLLPSDPPVLLAGLIAARRSGDVPLARYFARQLREHGIVIRFAAKPMEGSNREHADSQ
jgi:hypothetical protein